MTAFKPGHHNRAKSGKLVNHPPESIRAVPLLEAAFMTSRTSRRAYKARKHRPLPWYRGRRRSQHPRASGTLNQTRWVALPLAGPLRLRAGASAASAKPLRWTEICSTKRGGNAARPAVPTGIDRSNWRLREADTGPTDHRLARTYRVCRPDLPGQPELPERPQPTLLREPCRASGSAGYRGLLPRPRPRLLRVRSRRQARHESGGDL
jgi:hypothetical protein